MGLDALAVYAASRRICYAIKRQAPDSKTGLKTGDLARKPTFHERRDTGEIDPPPGGLV